MRAVSFPAVGLCLVLCGTRHSLGGRNKQSSTTTVSSRPAGCLENEVWYAVGATFKSKCNTCTCTALGFAICTKMYCGAGCLVGDVWHAAGASFYIDCNTCSCFESGYPVCTMIYCGEGCLSDDVWYTVGATFKKDCNTCTCSSHRNIVCTEKYCSKDSVLG
ncbi:U-reduvitoxin-Pr21-like isoform X3 [Littorina saxatilis]|uniref:U-reduvitoxin-Pr21-like isoform X3 n=1 Tax=Littorina saxatilis TaxID=31220 RepID=UPI0038B572FC